MLDCCGAPALWAGRTDLFNERLAHIRKLWQQWGKPKFMMACPSCYAGFKENLPEIPIEMLYTVLDQVGVPPLEGEPLSPRKLAIHDSCSTRFEGELHQSVRNLVQKMGHQIIELKYSKDKTTCCGYGGLMMFADKEIAQAVIHTRIEECTEDYAVYCAMCRDNFAGQGKKTYHLLDLLLKKNTEIQGDKKGPDFSQRHEKRARLKRKLLQDLWGETIQEEERAVTVIIDDEIRRVMEHRSILLEDIEAVISYAEETGKKMWNPVAQCYVAYYKPAAVTYWVAYTVLEDGYQILNTYSHRLQIEL